MIRMSCGNEKLRNEKLRNEVVKRCEIKFLKDEKVVERCEIKSLKMRNEIIVKERMKGSR